MHGARLDDAVGLPPTGPPTRIEAFHDRGRDVARRGAGDANARERSARSRCHALNERRGVEQLGVEAGSRRQPSVRVGTEQDVRAADVATIVTAQ